MIRNYQDYLVALNQGDQTESVSFNSTALLSWMDSVKDFADEFRVFLGVYGNGAKKGRVTTIIWPYKNGEPAETLSPTTAARGGGDDGEGGPDPDPGGFQIPPLNEGDLRP